MLGLWQLKDEGEAGMEGCWEKQKAVEYLDNEKYCTDHVSSKKEGENEKREIKCAMGRWQWDRLVSVDAAAAAANTTVLLRVAVSASTAALV